MQAEGSGLVFLGELTPTSCAKWSSDMLSAAVFHARRTTRELAPVPFPQKARQCWLALFQDTATRDMRYYPKLPRNASPGR